MQKSGNIYINTWSGKQASHVDSWWVHRYKEVAQTESLREQYNWPLGLQQAELEEKRQTTIQVPQGR